MTEARRFSIERIFTIKLFVQGLSYSTHVVESLIRHIVAYSIEISKAG